MNNTYDRRWQIIRLGVKNQPELEELFVELENFFSDAVHTIDGGSLGYLRSQCLEWKERIREPTEAECALQLLRMGFAIQKPNGSTPTEKELLAVIENERLEREQQR